jgi:DNA polymerase III gamma/tau subunit
MARMVKPVISLVVFALWAALPLGVLAEEKGGENASERSPDATARGTTYDEGPKNVFGGGKKEPKPEAKKTDEKVAEKAEPAEKDEAADKEKEKAEKEKLKADKEKAKADERARKDAEKAEKKAKKEKERQEKEAQEKAAKPEAGAPDEGKVAADKKCGCGGECDKCKHAKHAAADQGKVASDDGKKKCKCKGGTCAKCKQAAVTAVVPVEPTPEQKAAEAEAARLKAQQEERLRVMVKQLGTSGWREAQGELLAAGKAAVPILIYGMSLPEADKLQAYNLGGHTKADAGRAPRQRTIAEVCSELLTSMVKHHSNYKGEVPGADQKAWQEWWTANSGTVVFAK